MLDRFASIRRRETGEPTSFSIPAGHLGHAELPDVSREKRLISAGVTPNTPVTPPKGEGGISMRDLAHLPGHWTSAIRSLAQSTVPSCARPERWRQIVRDAAAFLLGWHDLADEHGWTVGHVFGLDPDEPSGAIGLAMSIKGGRVRRLFVDEQGRHAAHLERGLANEIVFRTIAADAPPLWALAGMEHG